MAFAIDVLEDFPLEDLFTGIFATSLAGLILYKPLQAATHEEIVDFSFVLLSEAAQRMLALPAHPTQTHLELAPNTGPPGVFDFYRQVFESGQPGERAFNYQLAGPAAYYRLAARRVGQGLLVSLTATAAAPPLPPEAALRESQAARAEAERQRASMHQTLRQTPAMICVFAGPEHVFEFVNPSYQQLVGSRLLLGRSIREAMPELAGQPIFELLDEVYRTGKTFRASEMPVQLDHANVGALEKRYYNVVYQARLAEQGQVDGILVFAYDVTAQAQSRQQLEASQQVANAANEELAATNEELLTANEEVQAAVAELHAAQQSLRALNAERTQALQRAQAEAERQRTRLERFFKQAPAAISMLDGPNLVFESVNTTYQQFFPGRQLLGRPLLEAIPEFTDEAAQRALFDVYERGISHEMRSLRLAIPRSTDGVLEDRYFTYLQQPRYSEQGSIDGVLVFALEVTAQVHAQQRADAAQAEALAAAEQLAAQREAFYQVFEQTPAYIALLQGPEHRVIYHNPAYQRLFKGRDMRGRTIAEIQPESVEQGFITLLDHVYQTGETYFGQEQFISLVPAAGGPPQDTYFDFTYQARQEAGQTVGISVFAYDITERVLARQRHDAQQQQLQTLFEQTPVAIAIFQGPHYLIEIINSRLAKQWGRTPAQVAGRPLLEALPGKRGQTLKQLLDQVATTGEALLIREVSAVLEGQPEVAYLNFLYQPLRNAQGHLTGVAAMATDVSEQVAARQRIEESQAQVQHLNEELASINEELAATNEELQASNEELGASNQQLTRTNVDLDNFIYTASHDLKAPISNIEGLLLALREELALPPAEAEVLPLLTMMQGSVERFKRTIAHLTDITKLQKVRAEPIATVSLAALVEAVRLDLRPQLEATGGQLLVDVGAYPLLAFPEKNLRSIVYNLLSNALKYHHPDRPPQVRLLSYPAADYAVLAVQDNGLGLDPAQQQKLFGMFQRLHDHVEGSGIGLYMVKKIVENAGGHIEVESYPGVGTTFRVHFPR